MEGIELLTPRQQLIRLSVDLRGVHPSEAELSAIVADPDLYEAYVDRWLDDDRLGPRMREVFNERFLTVTGSTYGHGYSGASGAQVAAAIAEEPLRLLQRVIDQDLPYTEMVTAAAIVHGDADRFLRFHESEHPVALQLGGSAPAEPAP